MALVCWSLTGMNVDSLGYKDQSSYDSEWIIVLSCVWCCQWTVRLVCRESVAWWLATRGKGEMKGISCTMGMTLHLTLSIVHYKRAFRPLYLWRVQQCVGMTRVKKRKGQETLELSNKTKGSKDGIYIWNQGTHLATSISLLHHAKHSTSIAVWILEWNTRKWYQCTAQWLMRYTSTYIKVYYSSPTQIAYFVGARWPPQKE